MKNLFQNIQKLFSALVILTASLAFSACKDDDDHQTPGTDQEQITSMILELYNVADTTDVHQISFRDPDGDGGLNGTITPDSLRLRPSSVYRGSLTLLDESNPNNVVDLTEEILEEATAHQFFYEPKNGLSLVVNIFDVDENQLPLGLRADLSTPATNTAGLLRISLSHYDQTPKNGTTPSGETDIDVRFPVSVRP